jgi:hypothetical protein
VLGAAWFTVCALVCALLTHGTSTAWASFQQTATSHAQLSADVLQPPTGLVATAGACGPLGLQLDLRWTASTSTWLSHYEVLVATASGGPYTVVAPQGGQSATATARWVGGAERRTTYFVVVRSVGASWWAGTSPVSVTTPNTRC